MPTLSPRLNEAVVPSKLYTPSSYGVVFAHSNSHCQRTASSRTIRIPKRCNREPERYFNDATSLTSMRRQDRCRIDTYHICDQACPSRTLAERLLCWRWSGHWHLASRPCCTHNGFPRPSLVNRTGVLSSRVCVPS